MWFFFLVVAAVVGCTSSSSPSFPHARYDRAITVFAPDGSLLQVEYASAVSDLGAPAVAVIDESARGVVLAASAAARREDGLVEGQKLVMIDEHIYAASAGLRADGRVLFDRARQECQEYRLRYGEPPSVAHISRFIADLQHGFTRTGGARPFGVTCIIAGVDADGKARIFKTQPSGLLSEWHALAIGSNSNMAIRELAAAPAEAESGLAVASPLPGLPHEACERACRALRAALMKNQDAPAEEEAEDTPKDHHRAADVVFLSFGGGSHGVHGVQKLSRSIKLSTAAAHVVQQR